MENKKIIFEEIKLKDIDKRYQCLDNWNNYYDWRVYKSDLLYLLEDTQTGECEHFTYLFEVIQRISSRALDYETDEMEYDVDDNGNAIISMNIFNYLNNLIYCFITTKNSYKEDDNKWLESKLKYIKELKVRDE